MEEADALVLFGVTGDLAYKKIFPALHAMAKAERLQAPVIGVAREGWSIERLVARAKESIQRNSSGLDRAAFERLARLLCFVPGDYKDPRVYQQIRKTLGGAERPVHYLAIPPEPVPRRDQGTGALGLR